MASTYSTNLAIELIGTGDQAGTWGVTTNSNLGTLIEQAISGYVTQAVATGTDTTITIPNGATGVARNMYIELTGTGGTNTNLIVPSNKKLYFIFNNSTGAVTVKVTGQTGVSVPQGKKMILVSNGTDIVNGVNYIADFGTNSFTVTNLTASSGTITNLIATTASISDASATVLRASSATLTHLSATSASITNLALTSLTISSLNITNVSVASATVSSNLVLSGGTANGVLYLNGSKVATSGSALTFDGTNLGVNGSVKIPQGYALEGRNSANSGTGAWFGVAGRVDFGVGGDYAIIGSTAGTIWGNSATNSELMRLTSTGLGIGTSSPDRKFAVSTTDATGKIALFQNGFVNTNLYLSADPTTGGGVINVSNNAASAALPLLFQGNGTTRMLLDSSGNLGIGTSSPAAKLESVQGTTGTGGWAIAGQFSGDNYPLIRFAATTPNKYSSIGNNADGGLVFAVNGSSGAIGTEALKIDPSGNAGLGVTPSASSLQTIEAQVGLFVGRSEVNITSNAYYNGGWKYVSSGLAPTQYQANGGLHKWFTAPSGTAGNAITFTQAMTLDASGNLQLGTTTNKTTAFTGNGTGMTIGAALAPTIACWDTSDAGYVASMTQIGADMFLTNTANGVMVFNTNNAERARITSGGSFKIGASNAGGTMLGISDGATDATSYGSVQVTKVVDHDNKWHYACVQAGQEIAGMGFQDNVNQMFVVGRGGDPGSTNCVQFYGPDNSTRFLTNGSERARITGDGYFKASDNGTYQGSTSSYHELRQTADSAVVYLTNTRSSITATASGIRMQYTAASPNGTDNYFLYCDDSTTLRAGFRSNGGLANYQSNNVDLSDARTKKDITPAASMWDKIGALEIVTYKYNDQTHDDVNVGVIAQQVEAVEPVWVDNDGWGGETPEDGVPLKTVYTKDITFAAIKALQEAMARIEKLEAEVAALKGA